MSGITETDSARRLLDIMEQSRDRRIYECFLKALTESDQQYIADCIIHNGQYVSILSFVYMYSQHICCSHYTTWYFKDICIHTSDNAKCIRVWLFLTL